LEKTTTNWKDKSDTPKKATKTQNTISYAFGKNNEEKTKKFKHIRQNTHIYIYNNPKHQKQVENKEIYI
jgi:hypothetical protein